MCSVHPTDLTRGRDRLLARVHPLAGQSCRQGDLRSFPVGDVW